MYVKTSNNGIRVKRLHKQTVVIRFRKNSCRFRSIEFDFISFAILY